MGEISQTLAIAHRHHLAGRLQEAEQLYRQVLAVTPDHAEAWHLLGVACAQLGNHRAAVEYIGRAVALKPGFNEAWSNLGNAFKGQGKFDEAVACYRRALELAPDNASAHNNLGVALSEQGKPAAAAECYRRAIAIAPKFAMAHHNLGNALRAQGKLDDAIASLRLAVEYEPDYPNAWGLLAALLQDRLQDEDIAAMRRVLLQPNLNSDDQIAIEFGLAQALDARGEFEEAAELFRAANASRRSALAKQSREHRAEENSSITDQLIAAFTPALFARTRGFGAATEAPVFIFGLPRSGTTLVEQILASHSRVFGAGELRLCIETFQSLPAAMGRSEPPLECVADLNRAAAGRLAERHLQRLCSLGKDSLRIVDKLPENFRYLGLIAILFPQARLIHCRRNLRNVALSCWKTNFTAIPWACDAEQMIAYFADYLRLMEHWRKVLPPPLLEVDYEEMVEETESVARRIVAWCKLDWEPGCLKFYQTERAIQTASAAQVRRPIYRSSVGRWKNYEKQLSELFEGVGRLEENRR